MPNTSYYSSAFLATKAFLNAAQKTKQTKDLKHILSPLRCYGTVTVGFSEKIDINMLTSKVKPTARQSTAGFAINICLTPGGIHRHELDG